MVERREINWRLYVIAFVISAFVFVAGILAGMQLTRSVNDELQNELNALKYRTSELELLSLIGTENNSLVLCEFYETQLSSFDKATSDFGAKLDFLEKSRGRSDSAVQELKREFSLMELRDFLFVEKVKKASCPNLKINTILFFYTNVGCPECTLQGEVGPPLKSENPSRIMIYAFDKDIGSPAVEALMKIYGVTEMPSLVINGKTFAGYRSKNEIEALLSE